MTLPVSHLLLRLCGSRSVWKTARISPTFWMIISSMLVQVRCFVDNKDSQSLYQMFANSRDYRDSIDVVDHGLPEKRHTCCIWTSQMKPAVSLRLLQFLAMEKISIKNIGIIHNREFEEGVLKIEFYDGSFHGNAELHFLRKETISFTNAEYVIKQCNKTDCDLSSVFAV